METGCPAGLRRLGQRGATFAASGPAKLAWNLSNDALAPARDGLILNCPLAT